MKSLARRIDQLERKLPPCSHCLGQKVLQLCGPGGAPRAGTEERCAGCDTPIERIAVVVAFDPSGGEVP